MPKRSSQGRTELAHECDQEHDIVPQRNRRTADLFYRRGSGRGWFWALTVRPSVEVDERLIGGIERSDFEGSLSTALTAVEFQQEGRTSSIAIGQPRGIDDQATGIRQLQAVQRSPPGQAGRPRIQWTDDGKDKSLFGGKMHVKDRFCRS